MGVLEYEGETPPTSYATATDWYILKWPYCLWVPLETPETPPRVGHEVVLSDEEDDVNARIAYWLTGECNQDAAEVYVVPVDSHLTERPAVAVPTATGVMHGGSDLDEDGEPDRILAYTFQDTDPGGDWRMLWIGADSCGPGDGYRRTHDQQRMLTSNKVVGTYTMQAYGFTNLLCSKSAMKTAMEYGKRWHQCPRPEIRDGRSITAWELYKGGALWGEGVSLGRTAPDFSSDLRKLGLCCYFGHGAGGADAGKAIGFGDGTAVGALQNTLSPAYTGSHTVTYLDGISRESMVGRPWVIVLEACEGGKQSPRLGTSIDNSPNSLDAQFGRLGFNHRVAFNRILWAGLARRWNESFWYYFEVGVDLTISEQCWYRWVYDYRTPYWARHPEKWWRCNHLEAAILAQDSAYRFYLENMKQAEIIAWEKMGMNPYAEECFVTFNGADVGTGQ